MAACHPVKPFAAVELIDCPRPEPNVSNRPRAAINRLGDIGCSGPDPACSVDSSRGLGKIGTVGSTYFSEIEKVLL
jgi:hypothetical protein